VFDATGVIVENAVKWQIWGGLLVHLLLRTLAHYGTASLIKTAAAENFKQYTSKSHA